MTTLTVSLTLLTLTPLTLQYKRTSFIVLSIGAVVALSAVMMGGHSLYNFMFPNPEEEGAGGFCSAGE